MHKPDTYILRVGTTGAKRLAILGEAYLASTQNFLRPLLKPKMRVLEVGCGTGNVSVWLAAELAKIDGELVGVDISPEQLNIAREQIAKQNLTNATFIESDIYDIAKHANNFDLVCCRFVLAHLVDANRALTAMIDSLRPGGMVACEEMDLRTFSCYPAHAEFDRHIELSLLMAAKKEVDFNIGPKIFGMLRAHGLQHLNVQIAQPVFATHALKLHAPLVTEELKDGWIEAGLTTEAEMTHVITKLNQFAVDDNQLMFGGRIFQVSGTVKGNKQ